MCDARTHIRRPTSLLWYHFSRSSGQHGPHAGTISTTRCYPDKLIQYLSCPAACRKQDLLSLRGGHISYWSSPFHHARLVPGRTRFLSPPIPDLPPLERLHGVGRRVSAFDGLFDVLVRRGGRQCEDGPKLVLLSSSNREAGDTPRHLRRCQTVVSRLLGDAGVPGL